MKNFFSDNFLNHVTFWCQITNTGNTILKVFNLVSSNTENIFNKFLTAVSNILKKRDKKFRLTAVHRG